MSIIDFHSHVLPGLDDGSRSVDESLKMLRMLANQGVDCVVASPHFYADRTSVERFLEKRAQSWQRLQGDMEDTLPELVLGAEVQYFAGMSRVEALSGLRIGNSELLLVEMPFSPWSERVVGEILDIQADMDCTVVLAHVERYLSYQKKQTMEKLLSDGVMFQSNADFFLRRMTRHKALRMLRRGDISLLGSDCHNTSGRCPNIGSARRTIEKALGSDVLERMDRLGEELLQMETVIL